MGAHESQAVTCGCSQTRGCWDGAQSVARVNAKQSYGEGGDVRQTIKQATNQTGCFFLCFFIEGLQNQGKRWGRAARGALGSDRLDPNAGLMQQQGSGSVSGDAHMAQGWN